METPQPTETLYCPIQVFTAPWLKTRQEKFYTEPCLTDGLTTKIKYVEIPKALEWKKWKLAIRTKVGKCDTVCEELDH